MLLISYPLHVLLPKTHPQGYRQKGSFSELHIRTAAGSADECRHYIALGFPLDATVRLTFALSQCLIADGSHRTLVATAGVCCITLRNGTGL